jgi:hypothetical protein
VGGLVLSLSHKGDADAQAPVTVVSAEDQRKSLKYLQEHMFSSDAWNFKPELYNHLAKYNWQHWGTRTASQPDVAIHDFILTWQDRILSSLLSSSTLQRLHDSQLRVPEDEDVFTTAELIENLTDSIYEELGNIKGNDYTNRKPAIDSVRRNLQRSYLSRLSNLALGKTGSPEDVEAVAYAELVELKDQIDGVLKGKAKLDSFSKAHLMDTTAKITRVLEARVSVSGI